MDQGNYTWQEKKEKPRLLAAWASGGVGLWGQTLSSKTRGRLWRKRRSRCLDGPSTTRLGKSLQGWRFRTARRKSDVLAFPREAQALLLRLPINANQVAETDLIGCQQIGHGIDNVAFDGALQVASAVTLIGTLLQDEVAGGGSHTKQELASGSF